MFFKSIHQVPIVDNILAIFCSVSMMTSFVFSSFFNHNNFYYFSLRFYFLTAGDGEERPQMLGTSLVH